MKLVQHNLSINELQKLVHNVLPSEDLSKTIKRADYLTIEDYVDAHGPACISEVYDYSFKNTVDELLAEEIVNSIQAANAHGVDLTRALLTYLSNKCSNAV